MKLNEKHLVSFANGSAAVDKQGYLNKRGELNKSFQRRWFTLKGNLLFYYDRKEDIEPIGAIILEGCCVELAENADKFSFELTFIGSGARTYVLAADSQEEMEEWMQVLACAGYDYMKCAVEELQRQLDELNMASHRATHVLERPAAQGGGGSNAEKLGRLKIPKRKNPFNNRDSFPNSESSARSDLPLINFTFTVRDSKYVRTFQEMHSDFGDYILYRTAQSKSQKS